MQTIHDLTHNKNLGWQDIQHWLATAINAIPTKKLSISNIFIQMLDRKPHHPP